MPIVNLDNVKPWPAVTACYIIIILACVFCRTIADETTVATGHKPVIFVFIVIIMVIIIIIILIILIITIV